MKSQAGPEYQPAVRFRPERGCGIDTVRASPHHPGHARKHSASEASPAATIRKDEATGPTEGRYAMTGHPGITERRDSNSRVRYQVRVRRADRYQTATLASLAEALAWRAQALGAAEGSSEPPSRPRPSAALSAPPGRAATVEDATRRLCRGMRDETLRTRDGRTFKPSTARNYEGALRRLVLPRIGSVPIATLRRGDVQRLVDALAAETSAAHARQALAALRVALRVAERYEELDGNPCAGVTVPAESEPRTAARFLTDREAARLLDAAERDDAAFARSLAGPLVALLLGTGLRIGEALAVAWGPEGLDLDAARVRVHRSLDRVPDETGAYPFISPKSAASRRVVPLPLEDVARMRRHRLACGRPVEGTLVFADEHGRPLGPGGVIRATWRRVLHRALLAEPLPRVHDLRHTYAAHALAAGISAHAVAVLLGHSDAGLVWRRYGHALPDEIAGAGAALEAWRKARGA